MLPLLWRLPLRLLGLPPDLRPCDRPRPGSLPQAADASSESFWGVALASVTVDRRETSFTASRRTALQNKEALLYGREFRVKSGDARHLGDNPATVHDRASVYLP